MLNAHETQLILEKFFTECFKYWKSTGRDERKAFELALEDIKAMKHNPYTPKGELLDIKIKENFIHYREMDLGGKK